MSNGAAMKGVEQRGNERSNAENMPKANEEEIESMEAALEALKANLERIKAQRN